MTILAGPNASGKTNAIEALQLLTALTSFRNARAIDLIRQGQTSASAQIHLTGPNRELDVALQVSRSDDINGGSSKKYIYNGKKRSSKDLRGMIPSVTFTPDDLELAKGSNKHRRRELDVLGGQVNPNYYQIVRDYEKVLRQKNRLLKDEAPMPLIEAADEVFQTVAKQLTNYRHSLFDRLLPHIAAYYSSFGGDNESLSGTYIEGRDAAEEERIPSLFEEAAAKRALAGPHLHAIEFFINGLSVRDFASQGQQRSLVLAIKLAQSDLINEILGQLPVLLLDDVMSELDGERRRALVKELLEDRQTFITTANIDYFETEILEKATVVTFNNEKYQ